MNSMLKTTILLIIGAVFMVACNPTSKDQNLMVEKEISDSWTFHQVGKNGMAACHSARNSAHRFTRKRKN